MASFPNHFKFLQSISFIFLSIVVTLTSNGSSLTLEEECLALFEFKESVLPQDYELQKFDSWKLNGSNNDVGCCSWDGVECINENHVTSLDLSESFLFGPINSTSALFKLVHLQRLNLATNDFADSQIPSEIGHLTKLKSLNLSSSYFTGQIPKEISQLTELTSLDFSWNRLTLQSPSLENLVQNLTHLEELDLSWINISSSVPRFLANFSSLRFIRFEECELQDDFPVDLFHLPKLKIISLRFNEDLIGFLPEFRNNSLIERLELVATNFGGIIPESITNLKYLTKLNLDECSFSGSFPGFIANMTQLTYLTLGENKFTGVVSSLVSLSELNVLALGGNRFERGHVPDWVGKLTKLSELYIYDMNIYEEFSPFIANLTKLSVISLPTNFIFGHIPSSFFNLSQLRTVDFGSNRLQGTISSFLNSNFKSLEILRLNNNNLTGIVESEMLVGFDKLRNLLLGDNKISFVPTNNYTNDTLPALRNLGLATCNLKEFPAFLRFKTRMTSLFLDRNKIEGLVPVWIWNNSQETLQTIDISDNFITGFHQNPDFLPWVRLETLLIAGNQIRGRPPIPPMTTIVYDASRNNLEGEISPLICEVTSLRLLDFSFNNMNGTLPPCLGNLTNSLFVLNLKQNNFHGKMMNAFNHGCLLKKIDFSENQFQGPIPNSLANCTGLQVLSLADNYFDGFFPFWLRHLAELQVLILRSNKFHGEIQDPSPTTVDSQFPKMRIIDLSNNGFSGQLPNKYIQGWNAMKSAYVGISSIMQLQMSFSTFTRTQDWAFSMTLTIKGVNTDYERILDIFTAIDLSSNKFEGEIPQSLQDLRGLESLNLSNNHLSGHVLASFGNLINLESLDLSQNDLSGEIPQQLLQLSFLAIFNVSFNHLNGLIPQGKQFNTFDINSFMGNPGLCGLPLSNKCRNPKTSIPPTTSNNESNSSLFPSDSVDWIIIFSGYGSGLAAGLIICNYLVSTRYNEWLTEKLGKKERSIKLLSNTRRSHIKPHPAYLV